MQYWRNPKAVRVIAFLMFCPLVFLPAITVAQNLSDFDRARGRDMAKNVKEAIKKNYYDPAFHGMDLEARFKTADEKIVQAQSLGQIFGIIAQAVLDLNDSHTFFLPPAWMSRVEYGWKMQTIGDACYIVAVKPGSDAEAKGLKPGDIVRQVDSYIPARENLWKMNYLYYTLRPQQGTRLIVQGPDGQLRQVDVMAKVTRGKRVLDFTGGGGGNDIMDAIRNAEAEDKLNRHRYVEVEKQAFIWKMPAFDLSEAQIDEMMSKVAKHKALILDLRGNGGGYELTLQRLLGHFFPKELKIGDIKRRKETKPLTAKSVSGKAYEGDVVVLIDSKSGSAAELFARVMQLEKRGRVIGDRSAGMVMRSKFHPYQMGTDTVVFYGASITDADIVMTDGKSLEHTGVTPDELLLPTGADLAASRDPVLSRAAEMVGIKLDPVKAGAYFPIEWRK